MYNTVCTFMSREKYEGSGFDYSQAEQSKAASLEAMAGLLVDLESMLRACPSSAATRARGSRDVLDHRSWDDVLLLPELRTLTCVDGLRWPAWLKEAYLLPALEQAGVRSYFAEK